MLVSIIDLEWTSWKGSQKRNWSLNYEKRDIIELGYVIFRNFDTKFIIKKNYHFKSNTEISNYFTKLTKITKKYNHERGKKFHENFVHIIREMSQCDVILCNGYDKNVIIENFESRKLPLPFFLKKIVNISPLISKAMGKKYEHQISSELLDKLKIKNKISNKHRASDDAHAIYLTLKHLIKKRIIKFSDFLR